jgi:predicted ATPase
VGALYGLWNCRATSGDVAAAMDFARQFHRLAVERSDATDVPMGDRMLGSTLHSVGEQAAARHHLETMLSSYAPPINRTATMRYQFDQRIVARSLLARVCWVQGFPDRAATLAATAFEQALATGHENAVCYSLVEGACPVALLTGDFALARRLVSELLDRSARHGLTAWQANGLCLEGELLLRCGELATGLPRLRTALAEVKERRFLLRLPALLGVLAEGYALSGRASEAAAAIEEGILSSEQTGARWVIAELLRIKGELLLSQGAEGAGAAAEDHFRQALDWARRQGALSWELRAAMSVARLLRNEGRCAEAKALLQPVFARFTEGFDTADLRAARALLDALG